MENYSESTLKANLQHALFEALKTLDEVDQWRQEEFCSPNPLPSLVDISDLCSLSLRFLNRTSTMTREVLKTLVNMSNYYIESIGDFHQEEDYKSDLEDLIDLQDKLRSVISTAGEYLAPVQYTDDLPF